MSAPPEARTPKLYTASWLLEQKFPDTVWIVDTLLPEGLTLFVARSKSGKSWVMLQVAVAMSVMQGKVFGHYASRPGQVLYLDLEMPPKGTQSRLFSICDEDIPQTLYMANWWPPIGEGGLKAIEEAITGGELPHLRMIVIDTIAKVWPRQMAKGLNAYYQEYELLSRIKRLADDHGISIVMTHHQNKVNPEDPLDRASGTAAMVAVPDCVWILDRKRNGTDGAELFVTGRHVMERKIEMAWDHRISGYRKIHDPEIDTDEQEEPKENRRHSTWYK